MEEKVSLAQRTKGFFHEVQGEMKKVTWPTRGELYGSVTVVIVVSFLLSSVIGGVDSVLGFLMQRILSL